MSALIDYAINFVERRIDLVRSALHPPVNADGAATRKWRQEHPEEAAAQDKYLAEMRALNFDEDEE